MESVASTEASAILDLARAISLWEEISLTAQDDASRRVAAVAANVGSVVNARRRELDRSLEELRGRQDDAADSGSLLAGELSRAQERLLNAERAMRLVSHASAALSPAMARFGRETVDAAREGLAVLRVAHGDIEDYLHIRRSPPASSTGMPHPEITVGSTGCEPVPGADGVYFVPLSSIDSSDRRIDPSSFTKGYTPADLAWAFHALEEVVLPTLATGRGIDYLRERDFAEGRHGTRSYADTYSGFLGGDAIRLDRDANRFRVANGYHRIWVASQMGLRVVPARLNQ